MNQESEENGAVAVLVALLLVVLLGFAAIAVDVGMLYAEKAQLRNGADATAIGVAQACAETPPTPDCLESVDSGSLAKKLADANSLDAQSNPRNVDIDWDKGAVVAEVGALEDGSAANSVSLIFANALGVSDAEVVAKSSAAWGVPVGGVAPFAIAFSKCEVDSGIDGDGNLQFLKSHGADDTDGGCTGTSSGHELPGGFGWLDQSSGHSCGVVIDPSSPWIGSDTGSGIKTGCAAKLDAWKSRLQKGERVIELIPIFDDTNGEGGNNGEFRMHAFAAFEIRGWHFNAGNDFMLPDAQTLFNSKYKNSDRGFVGRFVEYVSLDSSFEIKPMPEGGYGANVVKLTLGESP
ncbi:Tad domain-containing protein [Arthrobacter sp. D2-10]